MPDFDWGEVNGVVVDRLRAPKITPVPEAIVKQAQRSVETKGPGNETADWAKTTVLRHQFDDEAKAVAFARFMKKAGPLTKPKSSLIVVPDPEKKGNVTLVAWKAGKPRGRTPAA
jgi:hypothetical protein